MPRRGFIAKRDVLPDPIYNSKIVTKLINNIMLDGKKTVAQKIVYDAFDIVKEKENTTHFEEIAAKYDEAKATEEAELQAQLEEAKRLEAEKAAAKAAIKAEKEAAKAAKAAEKSE